MPVAGQPLIVTSCAVTAGDDGNLPELHDVVGCCSIPHVSYSVHTVAGCPRLQEPLRAEKLANRVLDDLPATAAKEVQTATPTALNWLHLLTDLTQAPSGYPSDVPSQLLDICDVVDACEGLSIEAVIQAAERELKPSGSPGDEHPKPPTAAALLAAAAALRAQGD